MQCFDVARCSASVGCIARRPDDVQERLAAGDAIQVFGDHTQAARQQALGPAGDVGGQDDVVELIERMFGRMTKWSG